MNMPIEPIKSTSNVNKPLWAAVGVLGVAVLAMGATLIRIQTKPEEPRLAVLSAVAPAPLVAASSAPLAGLTPASEPTPTAKLPSESSKNSASNKPAAPVHHAQTAAKTVATTHPKAAAPAATAPEQVVMHPAPMVVKPICANCGTVTVVTPIQRDGVGGGGGAIAGGVLGAVVGNQIGNGNGKALATLLGAVGGGFAGNAVEKKMKKETVYEVQVHMEDGSTRTLEQATPASVGAKVIIEGNTLQPAVR